MVLYIKNNVDLNNGYFKLTNKVYDGRIKKMKANSTKECETICTSFSSKCNGFLLKADSSCYVIDGTINTDKVIYQEQTDLFIRESLFSKLFSLFNLYTVKLPIPQLKFILFFSIDRKGFTLLTNRMYTGQPFSTMINKYDCFNECRQMSACKLLSVYGRECRFFNDIKREIRKLQFSNIYIKI